jgi:hypothetical protein
VRLEVELGSEVASVHAKVNPDTSFSLPAIPLNERCQGTGRYTVLLFPDPLVSPAVDSEPEQTLHLFTAWSLGVFCNGVANGVQQYWDGNIQQIPPGRYYALAVRDANLTAAGNSFRGPISAERRRLFIALAAIAAPVVLHEGENLELGLTDKTIDASRIAAKVGLADEYENLRTQNSESCCKR